MNERIANYVRSNRKNMSPADMARRLNCSEKEVREEMDRIDREKKPAAVKPAESAVPATPLVPHYFSPVDYLMAGIMFVIALALYVYTLSPGICAGDSGELTSAVFFLGGAHSPGYPLYCVVGKFFMNMLPFLGRAVYRLNFFSAFGGALTVGATFLVLVKLFQRVRQGQDEAPGLGWKDWLLVRLPAIAGSLFLLFSDELWAQSGISEVYTLNSLFVPFFFLILLKWDERTDVEPRILDAQQWFWDRTSKMLYAFYFLLGFSLGDHHIMLGVVLPAFFFILARYVKGKALLWSIVLISIAYFSVLLGTIQIPVPPVLILGCLAGAGLIILMASRKFIGVHIIALLFVLLGLFIYAYMPIRGQAYAPVHWGNPTNWERFSAVVLRKQYQGFAQAGELLSPKYRIMQLLVWTKWCIQEFSWPVFLLIIPGLIHLFRRDRRIFWFTVSFIPYYVFGLLIFNNFKFTPRDEFFAEVFWIPCYIVVAIWAAYGVRYGILAAVKWSEKVRLRKEQAAIAVAVLGILWSGFTLNLNFKDNDLHNNYENDNYGLNMLLTCDPNAILFTEGGDNQVFSLLYHHLVEHIRPDMRVWDQKGNVFEGLYGDLMRITSQQLAENQITGDYSQWATGRPIYYTWKDQQRINEINRRYYTPQGQAPRGFVTTGILYRIQPENIPYQHRFDYWGNYKFLWEKYPEQAVHWDYLAREIVANYNFQMGDRYLLQADELKNAYNAGMTSWQGIPRTEFLKQIDVLEDRGFSYYDRAAYFGFDMVAIHFNFGIFLEQKAIDQLRRGRKDKAVEYLKRAIERYKSAVDVDNEEIRAYMNLAAAYERLSSLQENEEAKWLEEAKKVLDRAKKMAPTYPQLDGYLQRISNRLKYPAAKLAELQNRVNTNPKDRPAVDELLKALLDRGDLQLGMQLLESVLKNYPNDWNYLNTLASLSGQLGDIGRTIRYLGMLGAIQPQNSAIWFNIGELYARQQDNRRATEYYRRTVVSGQNNPQFQKEVAAARQKLQSLGAAP